MEPVDYLRGLERRWKVILASVLVALLVGFLFTRGDAGSRPEPRSFRATTHLIHSATLSNLSAALRGATNLQTIAALVTIGEIPERVAEELDHEGDPDDLAQRIGVEVDPTTGLLSIAATAPTSRDAIQLSNAFAEALMGYLEDRNLEFQRGLEEDARDVERGIRQVDVQLESADPEEQRALSAERDGLVFDLQNLNQQIAAIESSTNPSGLEVVESATATPVTPEQGLRAPDSRVVLLLLAAIAGLLLGVGVALVLWRLDSRIETKDAAEEAFGLPVVGEIPVIPRGRRDSVVSGEFPHAPASNAFRLLAAALQFGRQGPVAEGGSPNGNRSWRTILVTSAAPSEGKSTTVANLAATFAQVGKRVVVMCCDFRHPSLHATFGVEQGPGLSELVTAAGGVDLEGALQETALERVRVLSTGNVPDNAAGLFGSERMQQVIAAARAASDVVLIDSAPVLVTSDWAQLVPGVDAVLVVARAGKTTASAARRTTEILSSIKSPVIGVVLNRLPSSLIGKGRYGYGFGRYGYGYAAPVGQRVLEPSNEEPAEVGANVEPGQAEGASAASSGRDGEIPHLARPSGDG